MPRGADPEPWERDPARSGSARRRKSFGRRPTRSQERDPGTGARDAAKALAEGQRAARSAIPERERATPQKLWPKANAQLWLLAGCGEGLEADGGLPAGSGTQRATVVDQQRLAIGLGGDQRETLLGVEDQ